MLRLTSSLLVVFTPAYPELQKFAERHFLPQHPLRHSPLWLEEKDFEWNTDFFKKGNRKCPLEIDMVAHDPFLSPYSPLYGQFHLRQQYEIAKEKRLRSMKGKESWGTERWEASPTTTTTVKKREVGEERETQDGTGAPSPRDLSVGQESAPKESPEQRLSKGQMKMEEQENESGKKSTMKEEENPTRMKPNEERNQHATPATINTSPSLSQRWHTRERHRPFTPICSLSTFQPFYVFNAEEVGLIDGGIGTHAYMLFQHVQRLSQSPSSQGRKLFSWETEVTRAWDALQEEEAQAAHRRWEGEEEMEEAQEARRREREDEEERYEMESAWGTKDHRSERPWCPTMKKDSTLPSSPSSSKGKQDERWQSERSFSFFFSSFFSFSPLKGVSCFFPSETGGKMHSACHGYVFGAEAAEELQRVKHQFGFQSNWWATAYQWKQLGCTVTHGKGKNGRGRGSRLPLQGGEYQDWNGHRVVHRRPTKVVHISLVKDPIRILKTSYIDQKSRVLRCIGPSEMEVYNIYHSLQFQEGKRDVADVEDGMGAGGLGIGGGVDGDNGDKGKERVHPTGNGMEEWPSSEAQLLQHAIHPTSALASPSSDASGADPSEVFLKEVNFFQYFNIMIMEDMRARASTLFSHRMIVKQGEDPFFPSAMDFLLSMTSSPTTLGDDPGKSVKKEAKEKDTADEHQGEGNPSMTSSPRRRKKKKTPASSAPPPPPPRSLVVYAREDVEVFFPLYLSGFLIQQRRLRLKGDAKPLRLDNFTPGPSLLPQAIEDLSEGLSTMAAPPPPPHISSAPRSSLLPSEAFPLRVPSPTTAMMDHPHWRGRGTRSEDPKRVSLRYFFHISAVHLSPSSPSAVAAEEGSEEKKDETKHESVLRLPADVWPRLLGASDPSLPLHGMTGERLPFVELEKHALKSRYPELVDLWEQHATGSSAAASTVDGILATSATLPNRTEGSLSSASLSEEPLNSTTGPTSRGRSARFLSLQERSIWVEAVDVLTLGGSVDVNESPVEVQEHSDANVQRLAELVRAHEMAEAIRPAQQKKEAEEEEKKRTSAGDTHGRRGPFFASEEYRGEAATAKTSLGSHFFPIASSGLSGFSSSTYEAMPIRMQDEAGARRDAFSWRPEGWEDDHMEEGRSTFLVSGKERSSVRGLIHISYLWDVFDFLSKA